MSLEDENFALRFELNALAELSIFGKAERWVPGFMWKGIDEEHRSRYHLACKYVGGKKVLDLACGSGYGSYLLADQAGAEHVLGFDLDKDSVRYGDVRYPHQHVKRQIQDVQQFTLPPTFDVIVSFETIEHLDDHHAFLKNVYTALKPGGVFIISTPIVPRTRTECDNPYHKIEWSFTDFRDLIGKYFQISETFVQSIQLKVVKRNAFVRVLKKVMNEFRGPQPPKQLNTVPVLFKQQFDAGNVAYGYQIIVGVKN